DPFLFAMQCGIAIALFLSARYTEAVSWAERALREGPPSFLGAIAILAASHALAGQTGEAQQAATLLLQRDPTRSVTTQKDRLPLPPEDSPDTQRASEKLVYRSDHPRP